jgi:hypothetical protein
VRYQPRRYECRVAEAIIEYANQNRKGDISIIDRNDIIDLINAAYTRTIMPRTYVDTSYLNANMLNRDMIGRYKVDVLDVGTEFKEYLDALSKLFDTRKIKGINVVDGGCAYLSANIQRDSRFSLFDGRNIPYFDVGLINMRMILHHVYPDDVSSLLTSAHQSLGKHGCLVILEHDYDENDEEYRSRVDMLDIVHDFYDFVIAKQVDGNLSQINPIDSSRLVAELTRIGFREVTTYVEKGRSYKDTFLSRRVFVAYK